MSTTTVRLTELTKTVRLTEAEQQVEEMRMAITELRDTLLFSQPTEEPK